MEKELNERYQRMVGLDDKMAKYRFLVEVSGMKHYGFKFFKVVEKIEKGRHSKDKFVYFGVNPDVIIRVNDQTKEVRRMLCVVIYFSLYVPYFPDYKSHHSTKKSIAKRGVQFTTEMRLIFEIFVKTVDCKS